MVKVHKRSHWVIASPSAIPDGLGVNMLCWWMCVQAVCLLLQRTLCLWPTNCYYKLLKWLMTQTSTDSFCCHSDSCWLDDGSGVKSVSSLTLKTWSDELYQQGQLRLFHTKPILCTKTICNLRFFQNWSLIFQLSARVISILHLSKVIKYIHLHNCCSGFVHFVFQTLWWLFFRSLMQDWLFPDIKKLSVPLMEFMTFLSLIFSVAYI